MNEYMKISEFAHMTGISRKTLIHYDRYGLLSPEIVDSENGYRYYSYEQTDAAYVIVSLREVGMSLKDIKAFMSNKSPEKTIEILGQQEGVVDQQIQKLKQIKGMIRGRIKQIESGIQAKPEEISIINQEQENLILGPKFPDDYDISQGGKYLPEFYAACASHDIIFGLPMGTLVSKEQLQLKQCNKPTCYYYILSGKQYPDFFNKPSGKYVVGREYTDYRHTESLYKKLFQFIEENHLQISGNAYEEFLIDEIAENDPDRYLLQIAIQISDT